MTSRSDLQISLEMDRKRVKEDIKHARDLRETIRYLEDVMRRGFDTDYRPGYLDALKEALPRRIAWIWLNRRLITDTRRRMLIATD